MPRQERLTLGQRLADKLTTAAGSWAFIIGLLFVIFIWAALNIYLVVEMRWDPYPFILLNLFLSCLAAIQAPVILMSQNRANQRDRAKAERDYYINRKAEREIKILRRDLLELKYKLLKLPPKGEVKKLEEEIKSLHNELEKMESTVLLKKK